MITLMQQQAIFTPVASGGIPAWQFGLILIMPGIVAVSGTIIWIRFQRVFALEEGRHLTRRQWFRRTLAVGAIAGVGAQCGMQGVIQYLTGMQIMWGWVVTAALITGLASVLVYELLRWWTYKKYKAGDESYGQIYEWLSLKRVTGEHMEADDLTVFRPDGAPVDFDTEDKTDPK